MKKLILVLLILLASVSYSKSFDKKYVQKAKHHNVKTNKTYIKKNKDKKFIKKASHYDYKKFKKAKLKNKDDKKIK